MENERKIKGYLVKILLTTLILTLILIYFHRKPNAEAVTSIMCALSAMSIGLIVGFLFGIPKTVQRSSINNATNNTPSAERSFPKRPNTNLEEVSDWLTKIIIGVGLVEFKEIASALENTAAAIAKSMDGDPAMHQSYIMALLIFNSIFGFLIGYILTRLFLSSLFSKTDNSIDDLNKIYEIDRKFEDIKEKISAHSEVESLVAQADHLRRKYQNENLSKWLENSEASFRMAINIDENNIPAHIGLSKCLSERKQYKEAWKILESLESKLKRTHISAKAHARIKYNKACYYFLYAKTRGDEERSEMAKIAFNFLAGAISAEPNFKVIAKNDEDWNNCTHDEAEIFKQIIHEQDGL